MRTVFVLVGFWVAFCHLANGLPASWPNAPVWIYQRSMNPTVFAPIASLEQQRNLFETAKQTRQVEKRNLEIPRTSSTNLFDKKEKDVSTNSTISYKADGNTTESFDDYDSTISSSNSSLNLSDTFDKLESLPISLERESVSMDSNENSTLTEDSSIQNELNDTSDNENSDREPPFYDFLHPASSNSTENSSIDLDNVNLANNTSDLGFASISELDDQDFFLPNITDGNETLSFDYDAISSDTIITINDELTSINLSETDLAALANNHASNLTSTSNETESTSNESAVVEITGKNETISFELSNSTDNSSIELDRRDSESKFSNLNEDQASSVDEISSSEDQESSDDEISSSEDQESSADTVSSSEDQESYVETVPLTPDISSSISEDTETSSLAIDTEISEANKLESTNELRSIGVSNEPGNSSEESSASVIESDSEPSSVVTSSTQDSSFSTESTSNISSISPTETNQTSMDINSGSINKTTQGSDSNSALIPVSGLAATFYLEPENPAIEMEKDLLAIIPEEGSLLTSTEEAAVDVLASTAAIPEQGYSRLLTLLRKLSRV